MSTKTLLAFTLLALASSSAAHMSIWTPAMYGLGWGGSGNVINQVMGFFQYTGGDPVAPLGPNWGSQDDWWFRGPAVRALPPLPGQVEKLPAGGKWTVQIACHVAWTSYGVSTTTPGSLLDACPGNAGAHHAGDPAATDIDRSLLSGCALAIADVDDISKVTMDNLAVFSVKHACVDHKVTTFDIPAKMPACTGKKCICAWLWLANNGTANFYMTAFDCSVTGAAADATAIAPPQDPVWCAPGDSACMAARPGGSKRPLYAYNSPSNIVWKGNWDRPGYHANWGFPNDGAQNDIFVKATVTTTAKPTTTTTVAATTTTTAVAVTTTTTTTTTTTAKAFSTSSTGIVAVGGSTSAPVPSATPAVINLAQSASATGSSYRSGSDYSKAIDGNVRGLGQPAGSARNEWVTRQQTVGAWIRLTWAQPQTFNQIVLFDRPLASEQVTAGTLIFDGNMQVPVGSLNNDGTATSVNLTSVTSRTVTFFIVGTSPSSSDIGLAEFQVFNQPDSARLSYRIRPQKRDVVHDAFATEAPNPAAPASTRHPRDFTSAVLEARAPAPVKIFAEAEPLMKRCVGLDHSCELNADTLFA